MLDFKNDIIFNKNEKLLKLWIESETPVNELTFVTSGFRGLTFYDTTLRKIKQTSFTGYRLHKDIIKWCDENSISCVESFANVWFLVFNTDTFAVTATYVNRNTVQFETIEDYTVFRLRWCK